MKIEKSITITPAQLIGATLAILLAIFIVRVAIWENNYYSSMEGTPRSVAINNLDEVSVADETEVTEAQIKGYTVPASHPRYLSIEKLGINNARILSLGTTKSGAFATPAGIFDAGWYKESATPGSGGTILLDGHNGGPTKDGIFKHLPDLKKGDIIVIERGDGQIFRYEVYENTQIPLADADNYMYTAQRSPVSGQESLTIISCSGQWDKSAKTYNSRQFVRAVKID